MSQKVTQIVTVVGEAVVVGAALALLLTVVRGA